MPLYKLMTALRALLSGLVLWLAIPLRRPLRTESDYSHRRSPWWELNYLYKYLWPRTLPERGSRLEEHFGRQSLSLPRVQGVVEEELSLRAAGDLMCRPDLVGEGGRALWHRVGHLVFGGDLSMANLELSVNSRDFILKPIRYAVPPHWVTPLLGDPDQGRFDYLALGNNHINDSLGSGVQQTCDFLEAEGVAFSGASRTPEEQELFPIVERRGIKVALLSYSFSTNGIPLEAGAEHSVNVIRFNAFQNRDYDDGLILRHVAVAKARGAEYIVVNAHWCCDHEVYPPRRVVERAHRLLERGVDLIIGHHPHIAGPFEQYEASDGRRCLVLYSLGSLTTYALAFPWQRVSLIAEVVLARTTGRDGRRLVQPSRFQLTPVLFDLGARTRRPCSISPMVYADTFHSSRRPLSPIGRALY